MLLQVKIWFQNRRAKERRALKKHEDIVAKEKLDVAHSLAAATAAHAHQQAAAQQAATLQARGALGSLMTAAGVVAFAAGLALECIADWQKLRFRAKRENKDKFITQGVWAWSRHPNYAGEIALWWGVFLFAAASLSAPQACAAAASPALVTLLLTKVSGVPLLERSGLKRWGGDAEYKAYRARTPCLWPDPLSVLGLKPSM